MKSFGKKNKNLVKKCVLFGYGFPLLIPSLAFLMDFLMKKYVRIILSFYFEQREMYKDESETESSFRFHLVTVLQLCTVIEFGEY